ncbi:MAG: 6-phosphogluconolactonase, partial [Phycisphaeraceae bacterium]
GHTASLFPNSPALKVRDRLVANNAGDQVTPPPRVTMTFPLLNAAREISVLVTGAKKAAAIQRVAAQVAQGRSIDEQPITGVEPEDGELTWYLDAAAAGEQSA